jgi:hypothetical protein
MLWRSNERMKVNDYLRRLWKEIILAFLKVFLHMKVDCVHEHYLLSVGRWFHGFEYHLRHGCLVCVCVYSVFVFPVFMLRPCDELISRPSIVCEK